MINKLLDLAGKTAIITGSEGIGLGIAYRLGEARANVVVTSRNKEKVASAVENLTGLGLRANGILCDVSSESDVKKMVDEAAEYFGSVDILVNNAGIYPSIPLTQMTTEDFEMVIDTNLKGVFLCTKYASEHMIKQGNGGKIINITSIDALHPSMTGLSAYDASKHGVWGFTKNIALELAQHKIWVNAIAPGGILTPGVENMQKKASANKTTNKDIIDAFLAKIPMRRMGESDDIAKVALFLASDMASYMTGAQIVVDGGVLLS